MRRISVTILLMALISIFGVAWGVQRGNADDTIIYIKETGNVDPATAPIFSADNITYTCTDDINDSIVIEKSNILLDGANYTINGGGSGTGIMSGNSNITIQNIQITAFKNGIFLYQSSNNNIFRSNVTDNEFGIKFSSSSNNTIFGVNIVNNDFGIVFDSSSSNTIYRNKITNNTYHSIFFSYSSLNTISENIITKSLRGIYFDFSSNNGVTHNSIVHNSYKGVRIAYSSNNNVYGNNITNNPYGFWLYKSSNHSVVENNIIASRLTGILLEFCSNNSIYHNNFVNNTQQLYATPGYPNFWDNDFEGNYWSNYTGVDSDHDGIGDTQHTLDANNTDNYPLMGAFYNFNTSLGYPVHVISNSTLERFEYLVGNRTIRLYVSHEEFDSASTFGFCRLSIHHELMDVDNITVIIDNNQTTILHPNYSLHDNGTHRWIYFAYPHTTHKIVIIPEFPSSIVLALIIMATLLVVICKKKRSDLRLCKIL